jgi:hypothetical protein
MLIFALSRALQQEQMLQDEDNQSLKPLQEVVLLRWLP